MTNQITSMPTSSGMNSGSRRDRRGRQRKSNNAPLSALRQPLTQININILRTLLSHRLLTTEQIQRQCLPCGERHSLKGRLEYTRHLLRVLHRHKYLLRRELNQPGLGRNPLVFASTWIGAQAVAAHEDCDPVTLGWDVQDKVITWTNENLHHLTMENEVFFTFQDACSASEIELRSWKSDRFLRRELTGKKVKYVGPHGKLYKKVLIPDGYYEFVRKVKLDCKTGVAVERIVVEVDMGTQTLTQRQKAIKHPKRTWEHKVKAYLAFFQSNGVYEKMYGSTKGRVLTITTSQQRLENMKEVAEAAGGNERFWFVTFAALNAATAFSEPIYLVAAADGNHQRLFTY